MINYSGHLYEPIDLQGYDNNSVPLQVNCCGYQKFSTRDFSCSRIHGRKDYQIIYIYRGKGTFYINNQKIEKEEGSIILFSPNEPQIFQYQATDHPEIYWIHFTGSECKHLLDQYGIHSSYIGKNIILKNVFLEIILELQLKKKHFEIMNCQLFQKLLILINRNKVLETGQFNNNEKLDSLIIELNKHYARPWSIEQMAQYCNLSSDYMSHLFKEYLSLSPIQYLTRIRINKAKDLLLDESITIADIAYLVGYNDPLYFSRLFRKKEGVSPIQYKRLVLSIE